MTVNFYIHRTPSGYLSVLHSGPCLPHCLCSNSTSVRGHWCGHTNLPNNDTLTDDHLRSLTKHSKHPWLNHCLDFKKGKNIYAPRHNHRKKKKKKKKAMFGQLRLCTVRFRQCIRRNHIYRSMPLGSTHTAFRYNIKNTFITTWGLPQESI